MAPVPTNASVHVRFLSSSVTHGIHCMGSGSQDFTNSLSVPGDRAENVSPSRACPLPAFVCVCGVVLTRASV